MTMFCMLLKPNCNSGVYFTSHYINPPEVSVLVALSSHQNMQNHAGLAHILHKKSISNVAWHAKQLRVNLGAKEN